MKLKYNSLKLIVLVLFSKEINLLTLCSLNGPEYSRVMLRGNNNKESVLVPKCIVHVYIFQFLKSFQLIIFGNVCFEQVTNNNIVNANSYNVAI